MHRLDVESLVVTSFETAPAADKLAALSISVDAGCAPTFRFCSEAWTNCGTCRIGQ